jgi:hypothetical protein
MSSADCKVRGLGHAREKGDVGLTGLFEHELAQRHRPALDGLEVADPVLRQWEIGIAVDGVEHRGHDEKGEEQRETDQHLIGRRVLGTERLP